MQPSLIAPGIGLHVLEPSDRRIEPPLIDFDHGLEDAPPEARACIDFAERLLRLFVIALNGIWRRAELRDRDAARFRERIRRFLVALAAEIEDAEQVLAR